MSMFMTEVAPLRRTEPKAGNNLAPTYVEVVQFLILVYTSSDYTSLVVPSPLLTTLHVRPRLV
jgi:hypothetical protein